MAKNIYGSAISNSSSKVEAYRKMLDIANRADRFRTISAGAGSLATKLGVVGAALNGGRQINEDLFDHNYSEEEIKKAVTVDVCN